MFLCIRICQEWPAVKVNLAGDTTILDKTFFTSLGANFYCDSINILFPDPDIQKRIKYSMTCLLKTTWYLQKAHYWYVTISHRR